MWWGIGWFIAIVVLLFFNYCVHGRRDANRKTEKRKA